MSAIFRLNSPLAGRIVQQLSSSSRNARLISTSQKNKEAVAAPVSPAACEKKSDSKSTSVINKNWVSYGFDFRDEANDRSAMKSSYFFSITLCLVWGTFVWSYLPDTQLRDWAQREGFLTLRQREAAGQEPISPDYIDRSLIVLPSDEELADAEIII